MLMTDETNTHDSVPRSPEYSPEREGQDGTVVSYRERVHPSPGMWCFTLLMTMSLGLAYARAYGLTTGLIVALATSGVAVVALIINSPVIVVDDQVVRAGNARLPRVYVGSVKVLDAASTVQARSKRAHPNAFYCLRTGVKESVLIEVTDINDPHPYWHISSRHAVALSQAINAK